MRKVTVLRGCDGTSVFHTDPDCPALTRNRIGWLAIQETVTRERAKKEGKRQCKRCKK